MPDDTAAMADELAALLGWRFEMDREIGPIAWISPEGHATLVDHPVPLSLDTLAAIWQTELKWWSWRKQAWSNNDPSDFAGRCYWVAARNGTTWVNGVCVPDTTNLLHDALSLTLAAMRVEKGAAS